MAEDEYEILSRNEISRLRDEIKALKSGREPDTKGLQRAIKDLNAKVDQMIEVFEAATEDLRDEDKESELVDEKIDPIIARISGIEEQNKKIAEGLVTINDIIEEKLAEISETAKSLQNMQEDLREGMEHHHEERFPAPPTMGPPPLTSTAPPTKPAGFTPPPLPGAKEEHVPPHKKKRFHLF
jgi:uncharacterized phage infection (PIP) family protein YhgE